MLCSAAEAVRAETAASEGGGRETKPEKEEEGLEEEVDDDDGERRRPPALPPPPPPRLPPRLPPPRLSFPPLSPSNDVDIARTSLHGAGVREAAAGFAAEREEDEKEAIRMASRASIRFQFRKMRKVFSSFVFLFFAISFFLQLLGASSSSTRSPAPARLRAPATTTRALLKVRPYTVSSTDTLDSIAAKRGKEIRKFFFLSGC